MTAFTYSTDPIQVDDWRVLELHPMCEVFPRMPDKEFAELRQSIVGSGLRFPIVLFEGLILDGRHRYEICLAEDIEPSFETYMGPGSAMSFVIDVNLRRRNLTEAQRLKVLTDLNAIGMVRMQARERQERAADVTHAKLGRGKHATDALGKFTQSNGDDKVVPFPSPEPLQTREEIAKAAGVSGKTASDFITVREKGTEEDLSSVMSGKASISGKAKEVRKRDAMEKAKPQQSEYITLKAWKEMPEAERAHALATHGDKSLNKQDNESIGWAKWSWNPITGCLHNCPYCYARDIANRFYEQGFEPSLQPSRLWAPQNQKPKLTDDVADRNIFTGSMADMFGNWVPEEWIEAVMASVRRSPEWNFLFLTKFPKRMIDREVPKNVWLGTTVDMQSRVKAVEDAFERVPANTRWLSIEPLIEPLKFSRPELFQWVVIGGASAVSATPAWNPPFEWTADLYMQFKRAGAKVYLKDNIGFNGARRPREFPWQGEMRETAPASFTYRGNQ